MSWFPSLKVFVYFKDERGMCVAFMDSLNQKEADKFCRTWSRPGRKVTRVVLQDRTGKVYKEYTY